MIEILPFEPRYAAEFKELNLEWLRKYFRVEPIDEQVLSRPDLIMDGGGAIFVARADGRIVGTVALIKAGERRYELTKMAVTAAWQGRGISRLLLGAALDAYRALGGEYLYLESSSILDAGADAVRVGRFRACTAPRRAVALRSRGRLHGVPGCRCVGGRCAADCYRGFHDLAGAHAEGVDYAVHVRYPQDSPVAVIAPHGGRIEGGTSAVARLIAGVEHGLYLFEGMRTAGRQFRPPAPDEPLLRRAALPGADFTLRHGHRRTRLCGARRRCPARRARRAPQARTRARAARAGAHRADRRASLSRARSAQRLQPRAIRARACRWS